MTKSISTSPLYIAAYLQPVCPANEFMADMGNGYQDRGKNSVKKWDYVLKIDKKDPQSHLKKTGCDLRASEDAHSQTKDVTLSL
ncbi:hypothetical protein [Desulfovibrio sp.]